MAVTDGVAEWTPNALLEVVIHEFRNGAKPEEIVASYDAVALADVYLVPVSYLRHPDEIDAYLRRREQEAPVIRRSKQHNPPAQSPGCLDGGGASVRETADDAAD